MPGSAPMVVETRTANPLTALAKEITGETLARLTVKTLRELLGIIREVSEEKLSKSGTKTELIKRILTSPHKDVAVQRFLADKDMSEKCKQERITKKLFINLRGALRRAGTEILRDLRLFYSVPALPEDKLPEGAHHIGECLDSDHECLLCRVFASLNRTSLFRNYTPPLVDDPEHKLTMPQEVNHVLIRTHARNVHRPDGNTLNFNQQYFSGEFVSYLEFPNGLPDPVALGFLLNCLEWCTEVGAAKAWGTGKLFIHSYALEKVEVTYKREWERDTMRLTRKETITLLKNELEHALDVYEQWLAQIISTTSESDVEEVVA